MAYGALDSVASTIEIQAFLGAGGQKMPMRLWGDEKGNTLAVVALGMAVILGMAALVIDAGLLYLTRARLSRAADAAALAGVRELPENPATAESVARDYACRNGVPEGSIAVNISDRNHKISVEISEDVRLTFAGLLGFPQTRVKAKAVARVGSIEGMKGVMPFGVDKALFGSEGFSHDINCTLVPKGFGWMPDDVGFVPLDLKGDGESRFPFSPVFDYIRNIVLGYPKTLNIGEMVYTYPSPYSIIDALATMIGLIIRTLFYWNKSEAYIYIPIVDHLPDRKEQVKIEGFACFSMDVKHWWNIFPWRVSGRFTKMVAEGDLGNGIDFGLRTYGLVE